MTTKFPSSSTEYGVVNPIVRLKYCNVFREAFARPCLILQACV
jgi:hypothetical protein